MDEINDVGAVVHFTGVVRSEDQTLWGLNYEMYEALADKELLSLRKETFEKFEIFKLEVQQKLGRFPAGEAVFHVIVHAEHRKEAFEACSWFVDQFKERIPVWKNNIPKD